MTVLMSGINMYAMALVMKVVLGWDIHFSIWVSSITVAVYVALGGLRSAIFNEVLQFFLIWAGALLIPILGLIEAGGWSGHGRSANRQHNCFRASTRTCGARWARSATTPWASTGRASCSALGAVISFGYWTTDFLVVQRVLGGEGSALGETGADHRRGFQDGRAVHRDSSRTAGHWRVLPMNTLVWRTAICGQPDGRAHSYNEVLPLMLARYCGPGLLGLGITALIAGFMSGMAGNVSAFATVWTYDIYRRVDQQEGAGRALRVDGPLVHHHGRV